MKRMNSCAALALMLGAGIAAAQDPLPRAQPADVGMTEPGLASLAASMRSLVDDGRRAGVVWGVSFADGFVPPRPFAGYGWGLAIGVRLADGVHTVPGSPGDLVWGGLANTTYFLDPVENIVAVAMTQYLGPDADELVFRLREGVYGALAVRRPEFLR